ncbi:5-methyltetrahydrofolate--homocysteine methyltransferase [candidate division KSB3 bacterium]|uniref:Methionine synthase n=1 Tax=candidate division KSB3 bacterium TaxID=2044937 RepID=A0A2G6E7L9_9BACT|nr:MAG: 5-methyltetrahydrofolate--homocysteine methyltransferase [candidate division KSB3 bacterium]PIE30193.1 MAG: 5-methyltetrahydrofolate--homocysteine methyltransferase [candidate division KSB3 bacterium]
MTAQELRQRLEQQVFILDGATGTELQKQGLPNGVCPEQWVIEHPESILQVQQAYVDAGADAVFSCTFGANRLKLQEFGLADRVYEMNKALAQISRRAVGPDKLIAGNMSATGRFVDPFGDLDFEEAVEVYKEQVRGLVDGGVDFFAIETMIDIQEMRSAVIAVKESCDLPIIASMTFSEDGHTLTGSDPISALVTLQSLGADVVGCNCSTGPDIMLKFIKQMKPCATVPLLAKPNAGLPKLVDGKTMFDMSSGQFASFVAEFIGAGANMIGGCCGTSPAYIQKVVEAAKGRKPIPPLRQHLSALSSSRKTVLLPKDTSVKVIGERINPTGKKKLQASLREGRLDEVKRFAFEQKQAGADLLDVNMGMSGIDEGEMMQKALRLLCTVSDLPLVIDSSNPDVVDQALRLYPGRALINSISAETKKQDRLLRLAQQYGAMFILLPLTDDEIPATREGRIRVVTQIYNHAQACGLSKEDIVIDGLTMTVSSDQGAAAETLRFLRWCRYDFGVNTVLGLSNVSFGLPQRKWVNAAFLAMAIQSGLTMAIANPGSEMLMNIKMASDVLTGNDKDSKVYIRELAPPAPASMKTTSPKPVADGAAKSLFDCVVEGDKDLVVSLVDSALNTGRAAAEIVDKELIPGINKVGELYEKKQYFLPQLIASADTMKKAFDHLEPRLRKDSGDNGPQQTIVLATVKGDIHDIGKNIVSLMMKNYGFRVIDLGKDVASDRILEVAAQEKGALIGLSALMTTTMTEMKTVIQRAKERGLDAKFIIGGAVITQEYADEIHADGYARDSIEAVKLAQRLTGLSSGQTST